MENKINVPSHEDKNNKGQLKSPFKTNKTKLTKEQLEAQKERIRLQKERRKLEEQIEKKIEEADRKEEKQKAKMKKIEAKVKNNISTDTSVIPTVSLENFVNDKNNKKKVSLFERWRNRLKENKRKKAEEKAKKEELKRLKQLEKSSKSVTSNTLNEKKLKKEELKRKKLEEKTRKAELVKQKKEKAKKAKEERLRLRKEEEAKAKEEYERKQKEKEEKARLLREEKIREKARLIEEKNQEKLYKKEEQERLKQEKELLDSATGSFSFDNGSVKNEKIDEKKMQKEEAKRLAKAKKEEERLKKEEAKKLKYKEKYEEIAKKKRAKEEKDLIEINEKREKENRIKKEKEQARRERREKAQLINKAKEESRLKAKKERKTLEESLKDWYNNLSFVRDSRNRKEMQRQTLLIDLDGADAVRSEEKVMYKYVAKNNETGKVETGMFAAFSKLDVHSFLLAEGYEVYEITPQKNMSKPITLFSPKFKASELDFFLTQLSTFLKSGITLVESVKILSKQTKKTSHKNIYKSVIYELTMGENFSEALSKQGTIFPRLLINMIKSSELTGDLPETLDDMAAYYREIEKTKKQMISALTYPAFVLCFAIVILIFMMVSVVPQFVSIYNDMEASLPGITVAIISFSNFLKNYWVMVVLGIIGFIVIFIVLYKTIKVFRTVVQSLVMNVPVMGKIIIYNEVTMFTKTFASLLNHNVYITDCMEVLSKITNNEVYKMLIFETITNLAKGEAISNSFKNHWAFPNIAYEMILTGEKTGQLGDMMDKVSKYYQELHKNAVNQIKAFIEPILIIILAAIVGVVLLSVVLPMFDMYQNIGV